MTLPAAGPTGPLDEHELTWSAQQATGLSDWGTDQTFRIGLGQLIAALNAMNVPSPLLQQARGRMLGSLATLLRLADDARRHPEILAGRIEQPVVVIGLPRTGTTIVYDMLALDPATRTPRDWEFAMPWPAPDAATWDRDPRIAQMNALFAQLLAAAPALADIQHFEATHVSECNLAFTHHFASTQFTAEWSVPEYARWLHSGPPLGRYAAHKRILQQLQWKGPRGRWTLKSPEHLFTLEELLQAYPDAGLVWTHREPLQAFSSLSSMICQFRNIVGVDSEPRQVGRYVLDTWSAALEYATSVRARRPDIDRSIIDVPHREVIRDKLAVVRRIHERFGLALCAEHEARMRGPAGDSVSDRFGRHRHSPEEFGITADEVRARLPLYYERFGALLRGASQ